MSGKIRDTNRGLIAYFWQAQENFSTVDRPHDLSALSIDISFSQQSIEVYPLIS